jgi:hypothetical protein
MLFLLTHFALDVSPFLFLRWGRRGASPLGSRCPRGGTRETRTPAEAGSIDQNWSTLVLKDKVGSIADANQRVVRVGKKTTSLSSACE